MKSILVTPSMRTTVPMLVLISYFSEEMVYMRSVFIRFNVFEELCIELRVVYPIMIQNVHVQRLVFHLQSFV